MHIDPLERIWFIISAVMTFGITFLMGFYAISANLHPPSNVETIDSSRIHLSEEFAEDQLGLKKNENGSLTVTMVAARYGIYPQRIEVPANTPIKFRMASYDVLHGVHAPFTNMASMIVPGYVSEVNTSFPNTGEYPIFCNEYCGLGHDEMWGRLIVTAN